MNGTVLNIQEQNVNGALGKALGLLAGPMAHTTDSRNGPVRVMNDPVMTIYRNPLERVLFSPLRNANPFFHLFEAMWMLAGGHDLAWVAQFNKQMTAYSDDGGHTQPAAYGWRWRSYFGYDQLDAIIEQLTKTPNSRRAVLAMWDGGADRDNSILVPVDTGGDLARVELGTADVPCNTHCYFSIHDGALNMAVMCRSNDALWGAYGANAVHFSILLEYMAARLQVRVGTMYQFSYNLHVYTDIIGDYAAMRAMSTDAIMNDHYTEMGIRPMPMFINVERFDQELSDFIDWADPTGTHTDVTYDEPFLEEVAVPMRQAWGAHKVKDYGRALALCGTIRALDWRGAATAWIQRREMAWIKKENGNG